MDISYNRKVVSFVEKCSTCLLCSLLYFLKAIFIILILFLEEEDARELKHER